MNVLNPPRPSQVTSAMRLSALWCARQVIDDAPAFRHAVAVARTLVTHVPDATVAMAAAALLHDAPLFAPGDADLPELLDDIAPGTAGLVQALAEQHRAMDSGQAPDPDAGPVTLIAAADKIVAFRSLVRRAGRADSERDFWTRRTALRNLLPYFHTWTALAEPHLPPPMHAALVHEFGTLTNRMMSPIVVDT